MIIHFLRCEYCQSLLKRVAVVLAIIILGFLLIIFFVAAPHRARAAEEMSSPVTSGAVVISEWNKLPRKSKLQFWALGNLHYLSINPACPMTGLEIIQNDEDGVFYYVFFCPAQLGTGRLPHPTEIIPTTILRVPAAKM